MSVRLKPSSVTELVEAVRSTPQVIVVGAGTKPRLSAVDWVTLSTLRLSGIVEYDPGEFTFTALAGTPLRDIIAALAERGQYLPFDPMLVDAGATLGGTVAAGLSGPGRFRFGGVRDFILAVQFVDGAGRLLRLGGKVVKNAAGFDLPKFFVGSLGRFGVLTEITFKVFPRPASRLTLKLEGRSIEAAATILTEAANARWELDALDRLPDGRSVCLRLAGPPGALESLAHEIQARWPGRTLTEAEADEIWTNLREFRWAGRLPDQQSERSGKVSPHPNPLPREREKHPQPDDIAKRAESSTAAPCSPLSLSERERAGMRVRSEAALATGNILLKVALAPGDVIAFHQTIAALNGAQAHISAGGNMAFISLASTDQFAALDEKLRAQRLSAVTLRGAAPLWLGARTSFQISQAVKAALDSENRFPSLDD